MISWMLSGLIVMNIAMVQPKNDDCRFKMIEKLYVEEDSVAQGRKILEICLMMDERQPSQHLRKAANWHVAIRLFTSPLIHFPGTMKLIPETKWMNEWKKREGEKRIKAALIDFGYLSDDGSIDKRGKISKNHVDAILKIYDDIMK